MTSPVDLVNISLDQITARTSVTGINPASPPNNLAAQVASRNYQTQVDAIFRAAHWNSARLQANLTLLRAQIGTPENPSGALPVPPVGFLYEYLWPNDCLQFRFIIPMPNLPAVGSSPIMTNVGVTNQPYINTAMPYVIGIGLDNDGNQIKTVLTNAPRAIGVYTGRIDNPDLWDVGLQNAVIGALSSWMCMPITGDKVLMQQRVGMAVGLIQAARMQDGNEGVTSMDHDPDFMRIRNTGSGWGWGGYGAVGGYYGAGVIGGWSSWGAPDGNAY